MFAKVGRIFVASVSLSASAANGQDGNPKNVFFGFDFVLTPRSIKRACDEKHGRDLLRLQALITAFPEDAERAVIQQHIDVVLEMPQAASSVSNLIGREITSQQTTQLCNAARPQHIEWPDVAGLEAGDGREPPDQRAAWEAFFKLIETV